MPECYRLTAPAPGYLPALNWLKKQAAPASVRIPKTSLIPDGGALRPPGFPPGGGRRRGAGSVVTELAAAR